MSKYNLIDIFEQYRIGSGWTTDFDYEGMLKAGLETGVDTDIEILRKMSDDFEDVNYHRENNHLQKAIDALEEGAIKEASMFFGDFHDEIKSTMETFDMEIPDTLGAFMSSKMEESEEVDLAIEASQEKAGMEVDESFKSLAKKLDKQKGIDKEEAAKIAGSIAAKKAAGAGKGPTAKQKKRMKEAREYAPMDRDVANRIEGFLNIPMKKKFLDAWEDLFYDLVDDEPFYVDDVIAHLANEMSKSIHGNQMAGDRLAGIGENLDDLNDDEYDDGPDGKFVNELDNTLNVDKVASPDAKAHDYGAEIKGISDEDDTEEKYAHGMVLPLEEMFGPVKFLKSKGIDDDIIADFMKTHAEDIVGASEDEIMDEFENFRSVNYDYIDEDLRTHFKRFI